jgi:hypothetical protein
VSQQALEKDHRSVRLQARKAAEKQLRYDRRVQAEWYL